MANSSLAHPASNMVDGSPAWYQSPPLSRGMQYREINITIDLEQVGFFIYFYHYIFDVKFVEPILL